MGDNACDSNLLDVSKGNYGELLRALSSNDIAKADEFVKSGLCLNYHNQVSDFIVKRYIYGSRDSVCQGVFTDEEYHEDFISSPSFFHAAVELKNMSLVEWLIKHNVDVNHKDKAWNTQCIIQNNFKNKVLFLKCAARVYSSSSSSGVRIGIFCRHSPSIWCRHPCSRSKCTLRSSTVLHPLVSYIVS
jgi:hypothetical protein